MLEMPLTPRDKCKRLVQDSVVVVRMVSKYTVVRNEDGCHVREQRKWNEKFGMMERAAFNEERSFAYSVEIAGSESLDR